MTDNQILEAINEMAQTHLEWSGQLEPEMDLVEDLQLDSLKLLTLAVNVENYFQICLEPEDEAAIQTVQDLVSVVGRKLTEKSQAG